MFSKCSFPVGTHMTNPDVSKYLSTLMHENIELFTEHIFWGLP